ncbi:MAG TPA: Rrf2 family transcriptional regulator [Acidimicrobiales bacterium]|nr:Rrf2 family transcriptional regulator [Acidimicrobiales bacterium]
MANRRVTAPLRVTERVDYALRAVLLLARHEGDYLTTNVVAEGGGMSTKMLATVLWNLRSAGILESRPGWHGGFRLARPPHEIPLHAVITAASAEDAPAWRSNGAGQWPPHSTPSERGDRPSDLVDDFWQALDDHVRATLTTFTVADLVAAHSFP